MGTIHEWPKVICKTLIPVVAVAGLLGLAKPASAFRLNDPTTRSPGRIGTSRAPSRFAFLETAYLIISGSGAAQRTLPISTVSIATSRP